MSVVTKIITEHSTGQGITTIWDENDVDGLSEDPVQVQECFDCVTFHQGGHEVTIFNRNIPALIKTLREHLKRNEATE